jgi:Co/Zn/Cd efflux system component
MEECCANKAVAVDRLSEHQAGVLRIALFLNGTMFLAEFTAGVLAGSVAVLADALDMLGDALVYGFSLHVWTEAHARRPGARWKGRADGAVWRLCARKACAPGA